MTGLVSPSQPGTDTSSQTPPDSNILGSEQSSTHPTGTAAAPTPGQDSSGNASNSAHQRPSQSRNSHSAQPVTDNAGHQRPPKSSRVPPTGNSVSNVQRQGNQITKSNNIKKKQVAKLSFNAANFSRPAASSQFCHHCKRKGHTEPSCLGKKKCDYCHRQGHSIQDCHTRLTGETATVPPQNLD